jgi:hypothetical protein
VSVIVEVIAPTFGIVLVGWLAARLRLFDEAATRGLSLFAFNFAIPVMLFRTLARADLPEQPEWGLVFAYFSSAIAVFALGAVASRMVFGASGAAPAIFGITAPFSNTIILGIPIVLRAFGDAAAVPLSLIVAFHSAVMFTLTTVMAEIGAGGDAHWRATVANVGRGLGSNPILWGIGAGLAVNLLALSLPSAIDQFASTLGAAALPAALFALGANLSRFRLTRTLGEAAVLTGLKILVQPVLVYLLAAHLFGLSPLAQGVLVTIAALPTGINAYLFAARYQAAVAEATSTILVSTLLSTVTLGLLLAAWR